MLKDLVEERPVELRAAAEIEEDDLQATQSAPGQLDNIEEMLTRTQHLQGQSMMTTALANGGAPQNKPQLARKVNDSEDAEGQVAGEGVSPVSPVRDSDSLDDDDLGLGDDGGLKDNADDVLKDEPDDVIKDGTEDVLGGDDDDVLKDDVEEDASMTRVISREDSPADEVAQSPDVSGSGPRQEPEGDSISLPSKTTGGVSTVEQEEEELSTLQAEGENRNDERHGEVSSCTENEQEVQKEAAMTATTSTADETVDPPPAGTEAS